MPPTVSLGQQDWSLHRKGPKDQARHQEKVREAIKGNLGEIISNESIITSDGNKIVKVPVRSLEEYSFRYDPFKKEGVGQGPGGLAAGRRDRAAARPGTRPGTAGRQRARHRLLRGRVHHRRDRRDDLRRPRPAQPQGQGPARGAVREDRLQRRAPDGDHAQPGQEAHDPAGDQALGHAGPGRAPGREAAAPARSSATTCATAPGTRRPRCSATPWSSPCATSRARWASSRNTSAARSTSGWCASCAPNTPTCEIVFITHHTEAKEVDEETFFNLGESGGTRVSSAYQLCLEIIEERYIPPLWNIYPFHFSDGDNWGDEDNRACVELVNRIIERLQPLRLRRDQGGAVQPLGHQHADVAPSPRSTRPSSWASRSRAKRTSTRRSRNSSPKTE